MIASVLVSIVLSIVLIISAHTTSYAQNGARLWSLELGTHPQVTYSFDLEHFAFTDQRGYIIRGNAATGEIVDTIHVRAESVVYCGSRLYLLEVVEPSGADTLRLSYIDVGSREAVHVPIRIGMTNVPSGVNHHSGTLWTVPGQPHVLRMCSSFDGIPMSWMLGWPTSASSTSPDVA